MYIHGLHVTSYLMKRFLIKLLLRNPTRVADLERGGDLRNIEKLIYVIPNRKISQK